MWRYDLNKSTEYLKYEFTDEEIAEVARDLAAANRKRASLEQRKKEVDAAIKAEIESENSVIGRLSNLIVVGHEYRDIEVRIELDTPEPGKKRIVRLDTGEEVAVKNMTDQDRQMVIDLQSAAEAEEAKVEPIVTPPPYQQRIGNGEEAIVDPLITEYLTAQPEATLGPAVLHGGTHQAKSKRGRNKEAEGFADGSAG